MVMRIGKLMEKIDPAQKQTKFKREQEMQRSSGREEWSSPVYSQSRHVSLDERTMAKNRCIAFLSESPYLDAFKVLRTRVDILMNSRNFRTIMITSVNPGEGKTLTSINLALAYAKRFDQTVLLVDCDFRRQDVHKYMGIQSDRGLVDYLIHGLPLKDLIIWPGVEKFTFISGGPTVRDSTEIIESPRMRDLVEEVKNRYLDRLVIFDTPPVLYGADTLAFASLVDGIILVVEDGRTAAKDVIKASKLLPAEKLLGFVLNRDNITRSTYY